MFFSCRKLKIIFTFVLDPISLFFAYFQTRVLSNESQAFEWWTRPPVKPVIKVHIFNYTNVDRWKARMDEKLVVEDVGPYVYQ